jgi:hypothetical protein
MQRKITKKLSYLENFAREETRKQNRIKRLGLCKCGKNPQADKLHTCPFAEQINEDKESLCNCCEDCTYTCAENV